MENGRVEAIVREVLEKLGSSQGSQPKADGPDDGAGLAAGAAVPAEGRKPAMTQPSGIASTAGTAALADANGGKVHVTMPLALAVKLIEQIEAKAAQWGMRVVTAVSDAAGRPVAIHCMDGAYIGSFDVALNKTYTSIAFQMSTAALGRLSGPDGSLYGIQFTNGGKIVIFGGGEVLERDGVIVGALGVSGGSAEQDTALAAYGKSIFEEVAKCL